MQNFVYHVLQKGVERLYPFFPLICRRNCLSLLMSRRTCQFNWPLFMPPWLILNINWSLRSPTAGNTVLCHRLWMRINTDSVVCDFEWKKFTVWCFIIMCLISQVSELVRYTTLTLGTLLPFRSGNVLGVFSPPVHIDWFRGATTVGMFSLKCSIWMWTCCMDVL